MASSTNRRSILLLGSTGTNMNQHSTEIKGDSYFGYSDGLHTIQFVYAEFMGRIHIQGTLSLTPTLNDWFDISPNSTGTVFTSTDGESYANFEIQKTGSEAYTFQGNYTFVRVYLDRKHIGDGVTYESTYGSVIKAILST